MVVVDEWMDRCTKRKYVDTWVDGEIEDGWIVKRTNG